MKNFKMPFCEIESPVVLRERNWWSTGNVSNESLQEVVTI
jgi:hypothetical protein